MGPGREDRSDLPSRPKFSFDLKNPPWTDGRGSQEGFFKNVIRWKRLHDALPKEHSWKIDKNLQGVVLQSQLFDRAADLAEKLTETEIMSEDGALIIAKTIHKVDPLSAVTDAFQKFQQVLNTKRGQTETFRNFEQRFDSVTCKYNAANPNSPLPSSLTAFLLLANSGCDENKRVSILAAIAPRTDTKSKDDPDFTASTSTIKYEDVASILRSCDSAASRSSSQPGSSSTTIQISAVETTNRKPRLTASQIFELKKNSKCHNCNNTGHWKGDPECPKEQASTNTPSDNTSPKSKARTVTFGMVNLTVTENEGSSEPGPMVDDGAPYCGMGLEELLKLATSIMPNWNGKLEPLPSSIISRPWWQYGKGNHASQAKKILGSVMLSLRSNEGSVLRLRHLIIEGSSPWLIGRNVTAKGNILHASGNRIEFPHPDGSVDTIQLIDHDMHSYMRKEFFFHEQHKSLHDPTVQLLCSYTAASVDLTWKKRKELIDKVHRHVCGHSNYRDIRMLLERNGIWNDECNKYLSHVLESCASCHETRLPAQPRTVSLSNLSREFNQLVFVDHFFLDELQIFHVMDAKSTYSAGTVVDSLTIADAIASFETCWTSQFWAPAQCQGDQAFLAADFQQYLKAMGTTFRPSPARRKYKNAIEGKHRTIRSVFDRLKAANPELDKRVLALQSIRISNDLYGNDIASATELAKLYTRPAGTGHPVHVPADLLEAHNTLIAKRKLNAILRAKTTLDKMIKPGDLIQVYIKQAHEKRGKWSTPKPVLKYDRDSQIVTVAGAKGKSINAGIEDVRHAIPYSIDIVAQVQKAIDECTESIAEFLDEDMNTTDESLATTPENPSSSLQDFDDEEPMPTTTQSGPDGTTEMAKEINRHSSNELTESQLDRITHIPAVPSSYDPETPVEDTSNAVEDEKSGSEDENQFDEYTPDMHATAIEDEKQPKSRVGIRELASLMKNAVTGTRSARHTNAHEVELSPGTELTSAEQQLLLQYKEKFGQKEFLLNHAQGLPPSVTKKAYLSEEESFLNNCKLVHRTKVPGNANVISSHVLYKIKELDDGTLKCKARIAPHGNKDSNMNDLKRDSATCPPIGFRTLLSICTIMQWFVSKVDIKGAFLQSGPAERDVYVVPPRECARRGFYWLLLVASYGLVNANAKWQNHSDDTLFKLGLRPTVLIPQLFFQKKNDMLSLLVSKVTDDMLVGGEKSERDGFIKKLGQHYDIGTITHMPGRFLFFGLIIEQSDEFNVTISADEKLEAIHPVPLTRMRRHQADEEVNKLEEHKYASVNGSLGFLGQNVSPFCAFYNSYLQQSKGKFTVHQLIKQANILKWAKKFGTASHFKRPAQSGRHPVSILVFADAAKPGEHGQVGYLAGFLIGELKEGSVFHLITWRSHRSARPVKSTASAETIAAGDAFEDAKLLAELYSLLLVSGIETTLFVDSKDLFHSLSTCRVPEDKSIRADVSLLRYYFETGSLKKCVWIPGKLNPADALTKLESHLCHQLQLMMYTGTLPMDLTNTEARDCDQFLG